MFLALNPDMLGGAVADETTDTSADVANESAVETPEAPVDEAPEVEDEGPAAEVAESDPEPEVEPEAPALSAQSLNLAKRMGLSDADLDGITTDAELNRYLTMLDRAVLSRLRAPNEQQQIPAERQRGEAEPDKSAPKFEKYQLQLDPEKWDAETVGMLNGINDHYGQLVQTLAQQYEQAQQQLNGLLQQQQAQEWQQFDQQVDGFFGTLEDTYAETFGKGGVKSLDPHSPAVKNRQELVAEMFSLAEADQRMGRQASTTEELLSRALRSRFPDQTKTIARKEIETKVQQRRRQGVARPSQREKPRNQLEKASANIIQRFKDYGFNVDDDDYAVPDSI